MDAGRALAVVRRRLLRPLVQLVLLLASAPGRRRRVGVLTVDTARWSPDWPRLAAAALVCRTAVLVSFGRPVLAPVPRGVLAGGQTLALAAVHGPGVTTHGSSSEDGQPSRESSRSPGRSRRPQSGQVVRNALRCTVLSQDGQTYAGITRSPPTGTTPRRRPCRPPRDTVGRPRGARLQSRARQRFPFREIRAHYDSVFGFSPQ